MSPNTHTCTHTDSGAPMSSHSPLWCSCSASAAKQRGSASRPARHLCVWSSFGRSTEPEPAESPHARLGHRVTDKHYLTTAALHKHTYYIA
ncbi:hypothetical protein V8C40DRAFT_258194 [Trichoderma camerunense]